MHRLLSGIYVARKFPNFVHAAFYCIACNSFAEYPPTCPVDGLELTGSTGTFGSPSYPLNYPNSVNCRWRIFSTEQVSDIENGHSAVCEVLQIVQTAAEKWRLSSTALGGETTKYAGNKFEIRAIDD